MARGWSVPRPRRARFESLSRSFPAQVRRAFALSRSRYRVRLRSGRLWPFHKRPQNFESRAHPHRVRLILSLGGQTAFFPRPSEYARVRSSRNAPIRRKPPTRVAGRSARRPRSRGREGAGSTGGCFIPYPPAALQESRDDYIPGPPHPSGVYGRQPAPTERCNTERCRPPARLLRGPGVHEVRPPGVWGYTGNPEAPAAGALTVAHASRPRLAAIPPLAANDNGFEPRRHLHCDPFSVARQSKAKATPLKGPTLTRVDIHFTIGHYDKGETHGKPANNTREQPCKDCDHRGQGYSGGPPRRTRSGHSPHGTEGRLQLWPNGLRPQLPARRSRTDAIGPYPQHSGRSRDPGIDRLPCLTSISSRRACQHRWTRVPGSSILTSAHAWRSEPRMKGVTLIFSIVCFPISTISK